MKAEIISVGTELLLGEISDTNATWLSQELQKIGLDLIFRTTVGDNEGRIASTISTALGRVDIVILIGGLGPTVDDVTREAIARSTGVPLEFHQVLLDQIAERFKRFKVSMTDNNRRQAYAPKGAILIENPVGTAPIFILQLSGKAVMCLPGVPREMQYLFTTSLRSWLQEFAGPSSEIHSLILRTAGIGESAIDAKIDDLMKLTNPTVGLAAHSGQTDVRITAKAESKSEALKLIASVEADIRSRLGEWIYATGSDEIEFTVARRLSAEQLGLAIVEIGTDNLLYSRLSAASGKLPHKMAHGSYRLKTSAPLTAQAESFAKKALTRFKTTFSAAALLVSDPDGATEIAINVASSNHHLSRSYSWATTRNDGPVWVTTHALALLIRLMNGHEN